jgi:hypothetical protein
MNINFKKLLELGQRHENEAIKRITNLYNVKCILRQDENNYKHIHYDFKTDDNIKYEVKADMMSAKTKNIFIEFMDGKNNKSGLTISEANYYIIFSCDNYYMIDINELKELTKNKPIVKTKDGTKGYLIKNELIYKNSIIL